MDLASKLNIHDLATSDYKFRFYSPHSLSAHYFLIDQLTGHVKTQRSLDREYLCETKACGPCTTPDANCSLPIQIVVGTSTTKSHKNPMQRQLGGRQVQQKFVSFDVIVEDKNEFEPKFSQEELTIEINENTPANFSIPLSAAVDRDSRQTPIIYSLASLDNDVKIDSRVHLETVDNKLSLVISEPFDYEQTKEMKFKLLASDGSTGQAQVGTQLITLKIIDLNDNLPEFDRQEYEFRLDENAAQPGKRLIRVHATDRDDGTNGQVKYTIVDGLLKSERTDQIEKLIQIKDLFQIDEDSGWISVGQLSGLDYEEIPTYRLTVKAQDQGLANSMPVYTSVVVYLNDVNDNAPVIGLTLPSTIDDFSFGSYESTKQRQKINSLDLSEWTMPETFLAQVTISDADHGPNGHLNIELGQQKRRTGSEAVWEASKDFDLVHLFSNIYSLMTKKRLDREAYDLYVLEIRVSDNGQNPGALDSTYELTVNIKDENDNRPVFVNANGQEIKAYEFNMDEMRHYEVADDEKDMDKWVRVGQVNAIDLDIGENSRLDYELIVSNQTGVDIDAFRIGKETGLIEARPSVLDYELAESFALKVIVKDNAQNSLSGVSNRAEVDVTVRVMDVNDHRPVFEQQEYRFEIVENLDAVKFGRVRAIDADRGSSKNSEVRYRFVDLSEEEGLFRVDEITGDLYLLKALDYERATLYELELEAYDRSKDDSDSLSSTCVIRIDVLDTNDNVPVLSWPNDSNMPLVIQLTDNNLNHVTLNVTDKDSDVFGSLRFRLEKQLMLEQLNTSSSSSSEIAVRESDIFECDHDTGRLTFGANTAGIYALVVRVTDGNLESSFQFNTRAYIFIALTTMDSQLTAEIEYLRQLVRQSHLNMPAPSHATKISNNKFFNRQNSRFNRLVTAYSLRHVTNTQHQLSISTSLAKVGAQLAHIFTGPNMSYLILFAIIASIMLAFILISLCLSVRWRRDTKRAHLLKASAKHLMNSTAGSTDMPTSANGSTSPSSMTSSELIVDNYNSSSSEENLKFSHTTATHKYASLSRAGTTKKVNIYDNYDSIRSPGHKQHTLLRGARANRNGPIGEEQEVLIVDANNKDSNNQLLVQINSTFDAKKMVASTESLTSYNSNNSTAKTSTTSQNTISNKIPSLQSSPNSFRTFKAVAYSPASAKSANANNKAGSYRTMPHNPMPQQQSATTPKKFDQKPLNLPVNELFKRYELKKNGVVMMDSQGNSVSSSTVHSGDGSNSEQQQQQQSVPDYFFKDQREYKKFLAGGSNKQNNIKQVVVIDEQAMSQQQQQQQQ